MLSNDTEHARTQNLCVPRTRSLERSNTCSFYQAVDSNTDHVEHSSITSTSNTLWAQHSDSGPRYSHIDQHRCPSKTTHIFEYSAEHNRTLTRTHGLNVCHARSHPGSRTFTFPQHQARISGCLHSLVPEEILADLRKIFLSYLEGTNSFKEFDEFCSPTSFSWRGSEGFI